jgi:hypothetical protein
MTRTGGLQSPRATARYCREMAAAARKAAAAVTFSDIRQSWLRIARQWNELAAQAAESARLLGEEEVQASTCFCGALLAAEDEPVAAELLNGKKQKK